MYQPISGEIKAKTPASAHANGVGALELRPGQSIELLKELHILTLDGKINQDSRRKLKQVYHLFQFIEKLLLELTDKAVGSAVSYTHLTLPTNREV